ncbi:MAG: hypothetical protein JRE40_15280 [Deltaproteobacteria bacterium]|nr:hypothetical protein [Deltaproteobacteria bacterium]
MVIGRALTGEVLDIEIGQPILLSGNIAGGGNSFTYEIETFIVTAGQETSETVQLAGTVPINTEFVFLNGVQLLEGIGDDYTFANSPTLLTFATSTITQGDIVIIKYSG